MSPFYFAFSTTLSFDARGVVIIKDCDGLQDDLKKALETSITQTIKEYINKK